MSLDRAKSTAIWVAFGLAIAVAAYGFLIEAQAVRINHIKIRVDAFRALEGKTIVHVTDLHMSKMGARERKVLLAIEDLNPDFVFLTGDFVKWGVGYEAAMDFLAQVKARSGVFSVTGDYDRSDSRKSCLFCHEPGTGNPTKRHRVKFLRNAAEPLDLPAGQVWLAGFESDNGGPAEIKRCLEDWKGKSPMIILSHDPLNFDLFDEDEDKLMLSGDTHGGQIPLPSWAWRILGYEKTARYSEGLFEKGRKKLFVSRGIGTSHIPFRLFKWPQIVVLHCTGQ